MRSALSPLLLITLLAMGCGQSTEGLISHPQRPSVVWGRTIQTPTWFAEYPRNLASVLPVPGRAVAIVGTSARATGAILEAVRTDDGSSLWRREMPGPVEAAGTIVDDSLYVGTVNGSVHRIHLPTGDDFWSPPIQLPSAVSTTPLVIEDSGLVVVRDAADRLTALSATDGVERWTRQRPLPLGGPSLRGAPNPVLIDGAIIAGFADGTIEALAPDDGSVRWSRRLCNDRKRMNDADLTPVPLPDGGILVGCHSRGIAKLSSKDGAVLWSRRLPGPLHATLDGERIWLTTAKGHLYALDSGSLEALWELNIGETPLGAACRCGGALLVPIDRSMMVLSPEDGLALEELGTAFGISASAACVDGDLLSLTDGGTLYRTRLLR